MAFDEKKRITLGVLYALVGFGITLYLLFYLFYVLFYLKLYGGYIVIIIIAIAFILLGIFSYRPAKTPEGNAILGLTSMIFGVLTILLPLIDILIIVANTDISHQLSTFLNGIRMIALYLIPATILLWYGFLMFRENYTPGMLKRDFSNTN